MKWRKLQLPGDAKGFTIVEIILAISIATVMIGVMFSVTFSYYARAIQSQEAAFLALESQALLGQIVEDLRLAEGLGETNLLADAHAPSEGWHASDANNVLLIRSPAATTDHDIIYNPSTGDPYHNEFIYFLEGTTMYKRTLKNPDAVGNTVTATCPQESSSSSCPEDRIFSENVTDLSYTMFDSTNTETNDPSLSRSVKITIALSKHVFGRTITLGNTTQVTQRNQ